MRVKVNSLYKYSPNSWDTFSPCTGNALVSGQVVRVINLPMAPKANTMGQCYVAEPATRRFLCMVSVASLERMTDTERGCYERLSKRRATQCVAGKAIRVTSGPNEDEAHAEVIR